MNREGYPRVGMAVNPVGTLTVEREAESRVIGWTVVRMCLQFVEDIAEDLNGTIINSISQRRAAIVKGEGTNVANTPVPGWTENADRPVENGCQFSTTLVELRISQSLISPSKLQMHVP